MQHLAWSKKPIVIVLNIYNFFLYIFIHVFNAHQYSCFKYFGVIFPTFFENKSFVIHVIVDSCSLLMFEITFLWRGSVEQRVIVAEANLAEY